MQHIEDVNTPCFILDKSKLENNFLDLKQTFINFWSNVIIGYSYKTNSLPWLLNYMKDNDVYAEVVSTPEYLLAKHIGYSEDKIILNGPNKGFDSIKRVLEGGGIVNLDSFHEIEWLEKNISENVFWEVGLRVNFDLEKECQGETLMGEDLGRFGFNIENGDFEKALLRLKLIKNIKIVGLHFHNSTKTKSLSIFRSLAKKAAELKSFFDYDLDFIDIGGGFFGDKPNAPSYYDYAQVITEELKRSFNDKNTSLIIEPGVALAASCFDYLTEVIDIRERRDNKIVTTDGSIMNIDPQMNGRNFSYTLFAQEKELCKHKQIISGYTCMEKDRYAFFENEIKLSKGDKIVFHNAGAYTLTFIPLFIEYLPEIYLLENNNVRLVREKWGVDEYVQKTYIK